MDFDTVLLRSFLHTAELGTVAAAAVSLGYTGPAVSQHLGKLERQLDTGLFDRAGGRLRLSESGARLVPLAREMIELADRTRSVAAAEARPERVVVSGFASAITALVVPLLTSRLARRTAFEVHEAEDDAALRALRLGQVDIALVQEYDGSPPKRWPRLRYRLLLRDRLRLVAPPAFPHTVSINELAEHAWLVNGSGTRCEQATGDVLRAAAITPRVIGRVSDNRALLELVSAGHGAAIVPELVLAHAGLPLTVARVDLGIGRTIVAVTRESAALALGPVLDQLHRTAQRVLPKRPRRPGS